MTKTNLLLLIALVIVSVIAYRISRQAAALTQWSAQIASQAPHPDPRQIAAEHDRQIVATKRKLQNQLIILRHMIPTSPSVDLPAGVIENPNDARDVELSKREASYLLREPLDTDEIRSIQQRLDPDEIPLPKSVHIYQTAITDWVRLRSRWPEPIGPHELNSIIRYGGYTPSLLSSLDPNIPHHRTSIEEGLKRSSIDARVVVDWPWSLCGRGQSFSSQAFVQQKRRSHQQRGLQ